MTSMTPAQRRALDLLEESGAPLVISAVAVERRQVFDPCRRRHVWSVSPLLMDCPGAYRASVAGHRERRWHL